MPGQTPANHAEQIMLLMCDLYRSAERRERIEARSYGLTPLQTFALIDIDRSESGSLSMNEAAERLAVSLSTMTRLADRLVEQRLIARLPVPGDRRGVRIALTEEGARLCAAVAARYLEVYRDLLEQVPAAERGRFIEHLGHLLVGLKAGLEEAAAALSAGSPGGRVGTPESR
jgi:DNA-binding MarR family transcriptional regulator